MKKKTRLFYVMLFAMAIAGLAVILYPQKALAAQSAYSTIEAENYNDNKSKGVSKSWENDGTVSLGWIDNKDYACYKDVMFGYGVSKLTMRYSKKCHPGVEVKVYLDKVDTGTLLCDFTLSSATGSKWTDFKTIECNFKKTVNGTHDVYFKFKSLETKEQLLHIDWFRFTASKSADLSLPPVGLVLTDGDGVQYRVLKGQKTLEIIKVPNSFTTWNMRGTVTLSAGDTRVVMQVTKIADGAAKNCRKMKKAYLGYYCSKIGKNAFDNCKNLNTVYIQTVGNKLSLQPSAFFDIKNGATIKVTPNQLSYVKKVLNSNKTTKKKGFKYQPFRAVG